VVKGIFKMKGLILCGGFSTRMQQDKSEIAYHGMPQWQYLYTLLQAVIPEVYLSCREDQRPAFNIPVITDSVEGRGPAVGLLSAHAAFPDSVWLVLACDLPLISLQSLSLLVHSRNIAKDATSFISPFNQLPEPLIAIWEPSGLRNLALSFGAGKSCPRKAMLQGDIEVIENPYSIEQFNANTPEEMQEAKEKLS
jgi:molybdopterin-guanine dinucleotide biosynthesis protein A